LFLLVFEFSFLYNREIVNVKPWYDYGFVLWTVGRNVDFHSHSHYQIIQVLDGPSEVDYGEGWTTMGHNSVHVLPPGYKHRVKTVAESWNFGIEFTVEADDRGLLDAMCRAFPVPAIQPMCFHESWKETFMDDLALGHTVKLRALHALEDWTISLIEMKDKSSDNPEAMRLAELLKTWNRRFVNVADVARELCWSRTKAELICKRRFGCGIMKLHEKIRME
jgi:hypothetical protein